MICAPEWRSAEDPLAVHWAERRAFWLTFCVTQRDFVPAVAAGSGTMPAWWPEPARVRFPRRCGPGRVR